MNLLGHVFYDPTGAAAVSKATTALLAMTALDTTNLRVTFTVPLSGKAFVKVAGGALHGAATYPVILVGILNGATVVARQAPQINICGAAAATTPGTVWAEFVVGGLTPGASLTWDLAYSVEQIVALTGWKYGGPNNNTTAGDAFGGISFEVWDPSPVYLPASMPAASVHSKLDTNASYVDTEIANIQSRLPAALVGGRMDSSVGAMAADVLTAAATAADFGTEVGAAVWASTTRLLTAGTNIALAKGTGVTGFNDLDAAGVRGAVGLASANLDTQLTTIDDFLDTEVAAIKTKTDFLPSVAAGAAGGLFIAGTNAATTVNFTGNLSGSVGSVTGLTVANLDVAVSTRSTYAGADTAGTTTLLSRLSAGRASNLDNLDAAVSSRLATAGYTAPDNATISAIAGYVDTEVGAIKGVIDKLDTAMELDGAVYRFTLNALELAPVTAGADNAGIAAIKAKTDQLAFTVAGQVDGNIKSVAGTTVNGAGTSGSPWGP